MRLPSAPWILFVVALALRLAIVLEARDGLRFQAPLIDAKTYDDSARAITERGPTALEVPYYQPPLYPMLLGAFYAVGGTGVAPPRVLQAILGAVTTVLVFVIGARIAGRRAGWIGALLFAGYGPVLFYEGDLLPTTFVLTATTGA
ncbi:MAG: tetratricopeptide repeat protein, partial [bacterium]